MNYKTIFISIFEGVEAKNILRTPVLATLLAKKDIRIVLFTKSEERVKYYQNEFNDSRILYEVVARKPMKGFDVFFAKLKFTLLRTKTTDLKRKMAYDVHKNPATYYGGLIVNRIFARPLIRKIVRKLDLVLVKDSTYDKYFEKYKPDLVFLAHLFDEPEIDLLRASKKFGVKSVGFVNSWDKVTARCIIRLLPDKFVVFNDIVKSELVRHDDVNESTIYVSGLPQYDSYSKPNISDKGEFFKKIGFDESIKKALVYAPNGRYSNSVDGGMIGLLYSHLESGVFGRDVGIIVRFQPNDFIDESALIKKKSLVYQIPGIRFSGERGVDWDMNSKDINLLVNVLYHSSVFVCYTSSLSVDAAVFDKPIINIKFELSRTQKQDNASTIYYKMDHYKNVIDTGGIRVVESKDELVSWINRYLSDPNLDNKGRSLLVREQCGVIDGKAGERIGNFILKQLNG